MTKRKVDRETVLKVCKVLGVVLVCAIAFAYAVVYMCARAVFQRATAPTRATTSPWPSGF